MKKETGGGKNYRKKVNLPPAPDRRPDLRVGLNLLHQAIPSDQGLTLSDPRLLSDQGQIRSYLGVHQGRGRLYQEALSDPGQILPDPEVLSDQVHASPFLQLDHRQLDQVPGPTHPERIDWLQQELNCDTVQNSLYFFHYFQKQPILPYGVC